MAVLAVLAVTGEYATGLLHLTLAATPRRYQAFGAKAAATVIVATSAGVAAAAGEVWVGVWIFAARGYTASRGYRLSLTDPANLRASAVQSSTSAWSRCSRPALRRLSEAAPPLSARSRRCCSRSRWRRPWSPTAPGSGASTNGHLRTPG